MLIGCKILDFHRAALMSKSKQTLLLVDRPQTIYLYERIFAIEYFHSFEYNQCRHWHATRITNRFIYFIKWILGKMKMAKSYNSIFSVHIHGINLILNSHVRTSIQDRENDTNCATNRINQKLWLHLSRREFRFVVTQVSIISQNWNRKFASFDEKRLQNNRYATFTTWVDVFKDFLQIFLLLWTKFI